MAQLVRLTYGYVESVDDIDGNPYPTDDFRSDYYDVPGIIAVYKSKRKAPGKRFAYFFPNEPDSTNQRYLRTSLGEMEESGTKITVRTTRSVYKFRIEENCLSQEEKDILEINAVHCLLG